MKGFKQWIIDNSYFDGETIDNFKFKNNYDLAEKYAEEQVKAVTVSYCCVELKTDENKLSFKDWKYSKGLRYLSGHNYKDNDGDLYDSDEIEKMYKNYISI